MYTYVFADFSYQPYINILGTVCMVYVIKYIRSNYTEHHVIQHQNPAVTFCKLCGRTSSVIRHYNDCRNNGSHLYHFPLERTPPASRRSTNYCKRQHVSSQRSAGNFSPFDTSGLPGIRPPIFSRWLQPVLESHFLFWEGNPLDRAKTGTANDISGRTAYSVQLRDNTIMLQRFE